MAVQAYDPALYTGQRIEPTTGGLYDYRARFYDPLVGSFLSADSIVPEVGHPRGWNRYGYVYGNPLKYVDPSGHCAEFGDDTCWGMYEKIQNECPECETIVTGKGIVPLHEGNYERLKTYYRDRIENPVAYEFDLVTRDGVYNIGLEGMINGAGLQGAASVDVFSFDEEGNFSAGTFSLKEGVTTNIVGASFGAYGEYTTSSHLSNKAGDTIYFAGAFEPVFGEANYTHLMGENGAQGGSLGLDLAVIVPLGVPGSLSTGVVHTTDFALFIYNSNTGKGCVACRYSDTFEVQPRRARQKPDL